MAGQETLISEKKPRRGPAPTGQGQPVMVRVHAEMLDAIDRWRQLEDPAMTRPEAMRRLVEYALTVAGTSNAK